MILLTPIVQWLDGHPIEVLIATIIIVGLMFIYAAGMHKPKSK